MARIVDFTLGDVYVDNDNPAKRGWRDVEGCGGTWRDVAEVKCSITQAV